MIRIRIFRSRLILLNISPFKLYKKISLSSNFEIRIRLIRRNFGVIFLFCHSESTFPGLKNKVHVVLCSARQMSP